MGSRLRKDCACRTGGRRSGRPRRGGAGPGLVTGVHSWLAVRADPCRGVLAQLPGAETSSGRKQSADIH